MSKGKGKASIGARILTMAIILIFLTTVMNVVQNPMHNAFSGVGYPTAFQGPKATFYGVAYNPSGYGIAHYSATDLHSDTSAARFDTVLDFDPDVVSSGKPNLVAEETSVYIPQQSVLGGIPSWLPTAWFNTQSYIQNPQQTYAWNITESDGNVSMYYMEQWLLRYYVGFSAEWDGSTDIFGGHGEAPPQNAYAGGDNSFADLQVWIKLDTEPTWYIQGQGTAYFCVAKVQLAEDVKYQSTALNHGGLFDSNKGTARGTISVIPERQTSLEFITYNPWGQTDGSVTPSYFQGHALNPAYFRNQTYIALQFRKFGVYGDSATPPLPIGFWTKGDTATFCFDVTVFVIGKWDVKDIQQNPSDYGRFQREQSSGDFFSWLLSAQTLSWLIPVAIFVAILFMAPWLLLALIALFRGGHK